GLEATEVTDSMITLSWDEVDEADYYDVEADGVVYTNVKANEYEHEGLKYSTEYEYRVRTVTPEGYSNWSDTLTVMTDEDPYRNVPENMTATWTGGSSYSGSPKDAIDLDFASQFHSRNNALSSHFIIDMKKVYELDKFEYVPRQDNFGNGTLQQFDLEYSIDGVNWKVAYSVGPNGDEGEWTWPSRTQDEIVSKTIPLEDINARYLRIVTKKSKGNFLTAVELIPYAEEGQPAYPAGDYNKDGVVDEDDLTFLENYAGLRTVDSDFGQYGEMADVNFDGVIDAYDIHYTAHQLFGGVEESDKQVEGQMYVEADKDTVKKGDTVNYTVYGFNMKHVNAFSMEINLDEEIHDVNSIRNDLTPASQHMESFSKYRRHSDGTHSNYIIASNLGEDEKLSGTIPIAKFEIRYREDSDDTSVNVEKADFVGSNLSTENAFRDEDPEVPSTTKVLTKEDIKSLTFTNDILEEDDGDNGSKLFQQENYFDILFDGDKSGN